MAKKPTKTVAIFAILVFFLGALFPSTVLASAGVEDIIRTYLGVTFGETCPTEEIAGIFCVIGKLINYLLLIVGAVSLVVFVVGGLQYMVSGGDEKALTAAKATVTYSVLGLAIAILASAIVSTVVRTIGLPPPPPST